MIAKLSTQGRLTLPKEIRDRLGWAPGAEIEIALQNQRVVLRRVRTLPRTIVKDVIGCVGYNGPRRSLEEMEAAIAEGVRKQSW